MKSSWQIFDFVSKIYSKSWYAASRIYLCSIASTARAIMHRHDVEVINKTAWQNVYRSLPNGTGLLTVSNHSSNLDDLFIWGYFCSPMSWHKTRWTAGASDILFTDSFSSLAMGLAKCVPVSRNKHCSSGSLLDTGSGVSQKSMKFLVEQLHNGNWVHMFPQGKVVYDKEIEREQYIRLKWGVGHLVWKGSRTDDEKVKCPVILPLWHTGLEMVNPVSKPYWWHVLINLWKGTKVTFYFGEPIDLSSEVQYLIDLGVDAVTAQKRLTDYIQNKLYALKVKTERIHYQG